MIASLSPIAYALGAAFLGAAVFSWLGAPAGALVGATLAVSVLAAFGVKLKIPNLLRNLGFTTIGVSLGAGITPHFLADILRYPASLSALTITVALVVTISGFVLKRFFGVTKASAILGTTPGALSYTLSLAHERREDADIGFIMVVQCLRLFVLTIFLPPAIALIDRAEGGGGAFIHRAALAMPQSLALIAVAAATGFVFEKLRVPAAFILGGMALSGAAHGLGLVNGSPAPLLTFIGFAMTGAIIGVRFSVISGAQLRQLLKAGLIVSFVTVTISGVISMIVSHLLALPLGQVWVSFAPGGVEAMSAMALSLGYDPAYVATHHIFRLILILVFLPVILRWIAGPLTKT